MSKEKQIDLIIDLLTEFDEMGFIPTTTVPDPEAYAIKWRAEITKALEGYRKQSEVARDALLDLKRQIHDKAVYPSKSAGISPYISLKAFDAILQNYLNGLK